VSAVSRSSGVILLFRRARLEQGNADNTGAYCQSKDLTSGDSAIGDCAIGCEACLVVSSDRVKQNGR
jgi:hypothetical protein